MPGESFRSLSVVELAASQQVDNRVSKRIRSLGTKLAYILLLARIHGNRQVILALLDFLANTSFEIDAF